MQLLCNTEVLVVGGGKFVEMFITPNKKGGVEKNFLTFGKQATDEEQDKIIGALKLTIAALKKDYKITKETAV